jgi:hypothetical protein
VTWFTLPAQLISDLSSSCYIQEQLQKNVYYYSFSSMVILKYAVWFLQKMFFSIMYYKLCRIWKFAYIGDWISSLSHHRESWNVEKVPRIISIIYLIIRLAVPAAVLGIFVCSHCEICFKKLECYESLQLITELNGPTGCRSSLVMIGYECVQNTSFQHYIIILESVMSYDHV